MAKARPEDVVQRAVVCHIQRRKYPDVSWFAVPNGGWRSASEAAIMQGLGVRAGVLDLMLFRGGRAFALELKRDKGGRLSQHQSGMIRELEAAGVECAVACGIDQAIAQLERWGLIRGASREIGNAAA